MLLINTNRALEVMSYEAYLSDLSSDNTLALLQQFFAHNSRNKFFKGCTFHIDLPRFKGCSLKIL